MELKRLPRVRRQAGSGIVEFALVAAMFLTLLLAVMDLGRLLFTWNAAAEATRAGARMAVVCNKMAKEELLPAMQKLLPQLTANNIAIDWFDPEDVVNNACTKASCKGVEVRIYHNAANPNDANNLRLGFFSPVGFLLPPVPAFPAYLPRESMESVNAAGDENPICL